MLFEAEGGSPIETFRRKIVCPVFFSCCFMQED